ncbi:RICIN domain-containing protein, partial [Candidatus Saccharibacteria bacterium]|nr:RICIN domain-containing protein [Candidatus Saccharibacteria bacterium]
MEKSEQNNKNEQNDSQGLEPQENLQGQEGVPESAGAGVNTGVDEPSAPAAKRKSSLMKKLAVIFGAVLVAIGILAALAFLLPDKKIKNGDINIGDITLTQEMFDSNYTEMDEYLKLYPDQRENYEDGDLREITRRDLILNAALRNEAKKCDVSMDIRDLAKLYGGPTDSEQVAQEFVREHFGEAGSFRYVRLQNLTYRFNEKLADCVIASRHLLVAAMAYDVDYLNNMNPDDARAAFISLRERMETEVLPLFEQGLSDEDIIYKADPQPTYEEFANSEPYWYAYQVKWSPAFFNDVPEARYNYEVDSLVSSNEAARNLKEVGDHTGVVTGENGAFMIIRFSKPGDGMGTYDSWDDFFEKIMEKYAYSNLWNLIDGTRQFARFATINILGLILNIQDVLADCWGSDYHKVSVWWGPSGGTGTVTLHQSCGTRSKTTQGDFYATCTVAAPTFTIKADDNYDLVTYNTDSWGLATCPGGGLNSCYYTGCTGCANNQNAGFWVFATFAPKFSNFSMSATTTIGKKGDTQGTTNITANVGDTIQWVHNAQTNNKDVKHDYGVFIGGTVGNGNDNYVKPTARIYQYTGDRPVPAHQNECPVPNGAYRIAPALSIGHNLVNNGTTSPSPVKIGSSSSDVWELTCETEHHYTTSTSGAPNTDSSGNPSTSGPSGFYKIINKKTGLALEVGGMTMSNPPFTYPISARQYTSNNSYAQRWRIVPIGDNKYQIYHISGLALEVGELSTASQIQDKANLVRIYHPNGTPAQQWQFTTANSISAIAPEPSKLGTVKATATNTALKANGKLFNDRVIEITLKDADAGKKICQLVRMNWTRRNAFGDKDSTPKCVTVTKPTHSITYNKGTCPTTPASMPTNTSGHASGAQITVSGTKPGCTGHTFVNWAATNPPGGSLAPSAKFNITANVTLTAQWTPVTPNITLPTGSNGTNSLSSKVNNANTVSLDYKNNSLNFAHTVTVGTNLNIPNASSASTSTTPALQAGTKTGSIQAGAWTVSAATGPSASGTLTKQTGTATGTYNKTLNLTGSNVGQICQDAEVSPKSSSVKITAITSGGYNVGWNVVAASVNDKITTNICAKVYSPWTIATTSSVTPTSAIMNDKVTFSHTVRESADHVVKNDDGANVPITATVYQHISTNGAKPDSTALWNPITSAGGSKTTVGESGYIIGSADAGKTNSVTVTAAHSGQYICQFVRSDKAKRVTAKNNDGTYAYTTKDSSPTCVFVPVFELSGSSSLATTPTSSAVPKQIDYRDGDKATWTIGFWRSGGSSVDRELPGTFSWDDRRIKGDDVDALNPPSGTRHDVLDKIHLKNNTSSAKLLVNPAPTVTGNNTNYNKDTNFSSVGASDVGYNICRRATFKPASSSNTGWKVSDWACTRVISKWTVTPTSSVSASPSNSTTKPLAVKPNDKVTFTHTLAGNSHVLKDSNGVSVAASGKVAQTGWGTTIGSIGDASSFAASSSGGNTSKTNSFTVNADGDEIGRNNICQSVSVEPKAWNSTAKLTSAEACIYIPYNYTTQPDVIGLGDGTAEAGSIVNVKKTLLVDNVQ